jgi:hypothetical protein
MSTTTLEVKIVNGVLGFPPLASLLATASDGNPALFEMQEYQGTAFPSMTYLLVSTVPAYGAAFRAHQVRSRVQFTIWDTNPERARAVENQLMAFLDQFNAWNAGDQNPLQRNQVVMRRQGGNPETQPLTFWRMLDAYIWNNEDM